MADEYDVIVIGGGPAGENAAWYVRDNDLSVAVVEADLVGGECSYWACMPSKALLRPGEALAAARRVPAAADAVSGGVDVATAFKSRDAFASGWDDKHQVQWMDGIGADLFRGRGRIEGSRTVVVTDADGTEQTIHARRAVIVATGSSAVVPPIDGLDQVEVWDSRDVTTANEVPERFVVLGGGVVGVEMAQAFRRLGSQEVTVVEMADRLLPGEEPFVGEQLAEVFADEGIAVRTGVRATEVSQGEDGIAVALDGGGKVVGDRLLVATGRRANTAGLGLETVGLEGGGPIEVDDQLRAVGADGSWLYAVGDVNGRALLTHQGKYQARVAADVIAGKDRRGSADRTAVPRVVFTDPQVAAVGMTEQEAAAAGVATKTVRYELGAVAAGALLGQGTTGTAHLVIDDPRRVIVGATFTGPGAGELLHAATIAIVGRITIDTLWDAVPAFPTLSEVWLRLLEADRGVS